MRLLDRFVAFILLLIFIPATIAALFFLWSPTNDFWLWSYTEAINISDQYLWQTMACLILLFSLELWLLFRVVLSRRKERDNDAVVHSTEAGDICISLETIRTVCLKIGHKIRGVRELYVRVKHNNQQESIVHINLKLIVDGERPIKELTEEMQIVTKAKVEQICGVRVEDVAVYVAKADQTIHKKLKSV